MRRQNFSRKVEASETPELAGSEVGSRVSTSQEASLRDAREDTNPDPNHQWCQTSNTAPSNLHLNQIKVDFDFLVFWVYGEWRVDRQSLFSELDGLKSLADKEPNSAVLNRKGLSFLVSSTASRGPVQYQCRYQLRHQGVYFGICDNTAFEKEPIAKIEIAGRQLTTLGFKNALTVVDQILAAVGIAYHRSKISRLDIKADQFNFPISKYAEDVERKRVISVLRRYRTEGTVDIKETLMFGKRESRRVLLRIYDKLAELRTNQDKANLFLQHISDGELLDSCTRIEFEILRETFKQFEVDSVEDCLGKLSKIVRYLVNDLFRIAEGSVNRKHTERAKTSKHWKDVSHAFIEFARVFRQIDCARPPKVNLDTTLDEKHMVSRLGNCLAKLGFEPKTTDDVREALVNYLFPRLEQYDIPSRVEDKRVQINHRLGAVCGNEGDHSIKQAFTGAGKVHCHLPKSDQIKCISDLFNEEKTECQTIHKRAG